MTTIENNLAINIVKEDFGVLAQSIVRLLIRKTSYPFILIANDLNFDKKLVSQILSILIRHELVKYKLNAKSLVEYSFSTKNALLRLKFPQIIFVTRKLFGEISEMIVEELLLNGSLEMSQVLPKVKSRIENAKEYNLKSIREAFNTLASNQYIKRCPPLDDIKLNDANVGKLKIPYFKKDDYNLFNVPDISLSDLKIQKMNDEENGETPKKMRKVEEKNYEDQGIYWKVNYEKYFQYFRDEAIIKAFECKIDKQASNLVKILLSTSHLQSDEILVQTKAATLIDIQKQVRMSVEKVDLNLIDKYMTLLVQDSFACVEKIGDFGGGAYVVDIKKAISNLCRAHAESYVREKHGSRCLRILKIVMDKSQIEQQQIEELAMYPSKDCKHFIYTLVNDNLLTLTELSKTADHAPSRTIYLFSIDYHSIYKRILQYSYKAMLNLMLKHEEEINEHKRLLEKQQKIDHILASLRAQQAEQIEIDEVKQTMCEVEINQMKTLTNALEKIAQSQMDLAETIFIFEYYFLFDIPYVKPTKK